MRRASLLGLIGASLLVFGDFLDLAEIYYNVYWQDVTYVDGTTVVVLTSILQMIFPISFAYLLYLIKKQL